MERFEKIVTRFLNKIERLGNRLQRSQNETVKDSYAKFLSFLVERVVKMPVVFTDRYGLRYILYETDRPYNRLRYDGLADIHELDFCRSHSRSGMTCFDVGANYGIYSLLFSKCVGEGGSVHSFEPEGRNYDRLICNIHLNKASNIVPNRLAVYSSDQMVTLNVFDDTHFGWHTLGVPEMENAGEPIRPMKAEQIQAVAIDTYCRENGIERIDLLKIDVEGAELDVIKGSHGMLSESKIGCVLFEISTPMVSGMGHEPAKVFTSLLDYEMSIYRFSGDGKLKRLSEWSGEYCANFIAMKEEAYAKYIASI